MKIFVYKLLCNLQIQKKSFTELFMYTILIKNIKKNKDVQPQKSNINKKNLCL